MRADHFPSTACDVISFNGQSSLCRMKRSFKPYQNELNSVKDTREKGQKISNVDQNFHPSNSKILKAFLKTFPTKMKPTKFPAKEKNEARKAKKEGSRESKSQDCCATFKLKNYLEIFSACPASPAKSECRKVYDL